MNKEQMAAGLAAEDMPVYEEDEEMDELDDLEEALKGAEPGAQTPEDESLTETPEDTFPDCERHRCFSCIDGKCMALEDNDFGRRGCPFYKPFDQARREQKACFRRLVEQGRTDLIRKYRKFLIAMDIFDLADDELSGIFAELETSAALSDSDEDDEWA